MKNKNSKKTKNGMSKLFIRKTMHCPHQQANSHHLQMVKEMTAVDEGWSRSCTCDSGWSGGGGLVGGERRGGGYGVDNWVF